MWGRFNKKAHRCGELVTLGWVDLELDDEARALLVVRCQELDLELVPGWPLGSRQVCQNLGLGAVRLLEDFRDLDRYEGPVGGWLSVLEGGDQGNSILPNFQLEDRNRPVLFTPDGDD